MRALEFAGFGLEHLKEAEVPEPIVAAGQVLVQVKAVSLNYRDLLVVKGQYNPKLTLPRIPCSDAAGEVITVGEGVTSVKEGDRVCGTFFQNWIEGEITEAVTKSALGGALDGVLSERFAFAERGLVPIPKHLGFEEAATLPCAALTAWNALTDDFDPRGKTILLQGTGGVSIFALQFAKTLGATVFLTTGSESKLERAKAMGADEVVNYKTVPDWEKWVLEKTGRRGVDLVVEVGGAGTLEKSVKATRAGGRIALIGVLAGGTAFNPLPFMMKGQTLQGIYVGNRQQFLTMNRFVVENLLRPVIHKVFPFADANLAFQHLDAAGHFGKVVIRL